ncbi:MAG: hypothetical protein PHU85_00035 [Phycisphaerae bacterium]|nr:hypothetical protein [Phycisphaerae bacterium]
MLRCACCRQPSEALICPRCRGDSGVVRQVDHVESQCRCSWPLVIRREKGMPVSIHLRPRLGDELGPAIDACPNCHQAFPRLSGDELIRHLSAVV